MDTMESMVANLDTWIPGYLDTWIPGYLDTLIPGCLDTWWGTHNMVWSPHTWWLGQLWWGAKPPCMWAPHHVCGLPPMYGFPTMYH